MELRLVRSFARDSADARVSNEAGSTESRPRRGRAGRGGACNVLARNLGRDWYRFRRGSRMRSVVAAQPGFYGEAEGTKRAEKGLLT